MSSQSTARSDGRELNQIRPPRLELRPVNKRADGSARFSMGGTMVMAAVHGPREFKKFRHRELSDRAVLEVVVRPRVGRPGNWERQLEGLLRSQLEHVVLHKEYPRTLITIIVHVISSDGSVAAVAGNATYLALMDAGVVMRATALGVSIGVTLDPTGSGNAVTLALDPTEAEERDGDSVVTFVLDGHRGLLVSSLSTGAALDATAWDACTSAASEACKVMEAFVRMSMQKRLDKYFKVYC